MNKEIKKVGIIGAGTIGSGMAAHFANAGLEVVLLDLDKKTAEKNIQKAKDAAIDRTEKQKKVDPFIDNFMIPENADLITCGDSINNMDMLKDCQLIVNAILANPQVMEKVYKSIMDNTEDDAWIVSTASATTTDRLTAGQSDEFKKRFFVMHPFGPLKYMHGMEIIPTPESDPQMIADAVEFCDKIFGKETRICKDTPGYIVNRLGTYAIERVHNEAINKDMKIEDVDAIFGQAFGFQKLGLFKLMDQVGLLVIDHVREELHDHLPEDDHYNQVFNGHESLRAMIEDKHYGARDVTLGGKDVQTMGGYYRPKRDAEGNIVTNEKGKPEKEVYDLKINQYRDFEESPYFRFEKQIKKYGGFQKFFEADDEPANFAWPVMRDIMLYTLNHSEEIAYNLQDVDDMMRAGLAWEFGPYELLDKFGVEWFAGKLEQEGIDVPPLLAKARKEGSFYRTADGQNQIMNFDGNYEAMKRPEGMIKLDDIKASSKPLITHHSASLWDLGDGVTALEFHSTKNAIDSSIFWVINESIKFMEENSDQYKGMVVYNDDKSFSFGANLKLVEPFMNACRNPILKRLGIGGYIEKNLYNVIEEMVFQGQAVYNALNQAPFPVVGAPKGTPQNMAFGGAAEILMHCDAIQSGPEQIIALPESGLGLVPAWGGSTRYLQRASEKPGQKGGPMPPVIEAGLALANPLASGASCAQDAKKKLWLSQDDGISMNPDRVLADAKAKVLELAPGYAPKQQPTFSLPGMSGKGAVRMKVDEMYKKGGDPSKGGINHVDVKVIDALADIVVGGETIKRSDVDHHVADYAVANKLKQIMDERGDDEITMHPGIVVNISRMLQLERDRFLDRFRDIATQKRVSHMLSKGAPLREKRLDPLPTPHEIRASIDSRDLERREIDGKPLSGKNGERLKAMADMTTEFYKLNYARTALQKVKQAPRVLSSLKHTLDMF